MNQAPDKQTASGSVDSFAAELRRVVGSWPPTAEVMERFKAELAEKAELEFQSKKRWMENQDRKMIELKKGAREVIQRNRDEQC